jgi:uncharacterized protein DUF4372
MNRGRSVFAQFLDFVPFSHFEHLVDRFGANRGIKHFSGWSHLLCMMYSQLTRREGLRLRDLVACLNSQRSKLYHIGIRGKISRSTLADANERRDWRLFEALGHRLIQDGPCFTVAKRFFPNLLRKTRSNTLLIGSKHLSKINKDVAVGSPSLFPIIWKRIDKRKPTESQ